jgi:hypothetical protein
VLKSIKSTKIAGSCCQSTHNEYPSHALLRPQ